MSKNLALIYPFAKTMGEPLEHHINIKENQRFLCIPMAELSETEQQLLHSLYETKSEVGTTNRWQAFLAEQSTEMPKLAVPIRLVYFDLRTPLGSDLQIEWLHLFNAFFDGCISSFFMNATSGVLIEEKQHAPHTEETLRPLIELLDNDFFTQTTCYLGTYQSVTRQLPLTFKEEQRLFKMFVAKQLAEHVVSLPQFYLQVEGQQLVSNSSMLQQLKRTINDQPEIEPIIRTLWHNDGNLALSAQKLYIHRNTLLYRIEKFKEETNLQLKKMADLTLCYLLVIA
ncbi:helix-turn-helix domain-containing protein [Brochothrix campestris]